MPKIQFLVALNGACDELAVRLFDTEEQVIRFIRDNKPHPVDGTGSGTAPAPLAQACSVRRCGPSLVFGYGITRFSDGVPVEWTAARWGDTDESGIFTEDAEFQPYAPLFPVPVPDECPSERSYQEEWDTTGGGPVS